MRGQQICRGKVYQSETAESLILASEIRRSQGTLKHVTLYEVTRACLNSETTYLFNHPTLCKNDQHPPIDVPLGSRAVHIKLAISLESARVAIEFRVRQREVDL
jgi:hypothetical protein